MIFNCWSLLTGFLLVTTGARQLRTSDPNSENHLPESVDYTDFPLGIPNTPENDIPGEPLTPEDFKHAENLVQDEPPNDLVTGDPIEMAGLFEGDISGISRDDATTFIGHRNAITESYRKWPGAEIAYVISRSFSKYDRSVIAKAVRMYEKYTCIKFVPRTTQRDYIHILKGSGCSSNVGRTGGGQTVSLGQGCVYTGVVIHELMHAAGFWHEQSREDRDDFISIIWNNIIKGMEYNFHKYTSGSVQDLGAPYDTGSIMHYGPYAFAKNKRYPTIIAKKDGKDLGQRRGFSKTDIFKLNALYQCTGSVTTVAPPTVTTESPDSCADTDPSCPRWAQMGECSKNSAWMHVGCRKSCKVCKTCADENKHCSYWARKNECNRNAAYMNLYCAKSCGACGSTGTPNPSCKDQHKHCKAWASKGECQTNPTYMLLYCRKSCADC